MEVPCSPRARRALPLAEARKKAERMTPNAVCATLRDGLPEKQLRRLVPSLTPARASALLRAVDSTTIMVVTEAALATIVVLAVILVRRKGSGEASAQLRCVAMRP